MIVVLDPGHGGPYRGCSGGLLVESDYVLSMARQVRALLTDDDVTLTRDSDKHVPHFERCSISRSVRADLVISLHVNAQTPPSMHGFRSFYWPRNMRARGVGLAINEAMPEPLSDVRVPRPCRRDWAQQTEGWLHYPGKICGSHSGDTLLLELGFVTWPADRARMLDSQTEIAAAIVAGVDYYRSLHHG